MSTLGNLALQELAHTVLAQHAGPAAGAEAVAGAARRAYDELVPVLAPLIGVAGVDALTGRALHLVQREYTWLAQPRHPAPPDGLFARVVFSLERQETAIATQAAGAVFATLIGLLGTFIGESLTAGLLRKAWPAAFTGAIGEEMKA